MIAPSLLPSQIGSALQSAKINQPSPPSSKNEGRIFVLSRKKSQDNISQILHCEIHPWQMENSKKVLHRLDTPKGPAWLICLWAESDDHRLNEIPQDINDVSTYSLTRDHLGRTYNLALSENCDSIEVVFVDTPSDSIVGGLVGIEMGQYKYKDTLKPRKKVPLYINRLGGSSISSKQLNKAMALGEAVNISRHLVNIPPSQLNPETYTSALISLFRKYTALKVSIWKKNRLEKEGMGLLLGVGRGAEHSPCMVHLKYRPLGAKGKPIAFVGKGITFDTGGLDLKPTSAMRLMKKDMGGAAAVAGLAYWACCSQVKKNLDFYLAIAENSISAKAMRPSDVLKARNGMTVEVDNTDAEGRLVLADVLDVAKNQTEKPRYVVDIATLTGAIKAALGCEVGGLFGNNRELINKIHKSSMARGDLLWPMPLIHNYRSQLDSTFADMKNCSNGWGGAVTAALFLESFVQDVSWAHLDIYAWNDQPKGAICEVGGSGQAVQCLAHWLS